MPAFLPEGHPSEVIVAGLKKKAVSLFIEDGEPLTRLELFMRSRGIRPIDFAREACISRQLLLRARKGELEPTRGKIALMVSAARRIAMEVVQPDELFELIAEEAGLWINAKARRHAIRAAAAHARDRGVAAALVTSLRSSPSAWASEVRTKQPVLIEPVMRRLIYVAYRELDRNPARAHDILSATQELSADLPSTTMPELRAAFRGRAFLYQARALLQMGNYSEALSALDSAEREYEGVSFCTNELAQTWYERATVLFKSGRLDDSDRLAKRAISVFTLAGDSRRAAKARIIQACLRFERGDVGGARDIWQLVIEPLRLAEDVEAVAAVSLNLGSAETLLGNVESAKSCLQRALTMFTKAGVRGEIIRTHWSMAKLRVLHEDRADGLRLLRAVRSEFTSAEMPAEAGFVALDLAEQLLEEEGSSDEAATLCRSAATAFKHAGATPKMLEALGYLREATRRRTADSQLVREVRRYLELAARGREVFFEPLHQ